MIEGPQLLELIPVGVLLGAGRPLLARRARKAEIELRGKGNHAALLLDLARFDLAVLLIALGDLDRHRAELAVGHLEQHTRQRLPDRRGRGPDEADRRVDEVFIAAAVFVIGDERIGRALLDLREDGLALPDRGAGDRGIQLAVKLHADRRIVFRDVLVVDRHRAALKVHTVVDRDAVIDLVGARVGIERLLGDRGIVAAALPSRAVRRRLRLAELAAEGEQDLLVLRRVRLELFKGFLVRKGVDRVLSPGVFHGLDHGQHAVGVVLVFDVIRDRKLQRGRGLLLLRRRDDACGDRRVRPFERQVIAARRKGDILGDGDVKHAVLDGQILVRQHDAAAAVPAVDAEIPVGAVIQHRGVGDGDKQVPRARLIDRLRRHRGKADLRHAAVTAGQQDIGNRLAELVGLGDIAVCLRRVIDADGDALIGRLVRAFRLEIERLCHGGAHLDVAVRRGHRLNRVEVEARRRLAVVVQRPQIGRGAHGENDVRKIDRARHVDVREVCRNHEVRDAAVALPDEVGLSGIQRKAHRRGEIHRHAVRRRDIGMCIHAVVGDERRVRAARDRAEVEIERIRAVGRAVFVARIGEVQRRQRREVVERPGQAVPVAECDRIRQDGIDRVGRGADVCGIVHRVEVLRDGIGAAVQQPLGGDRLNVRLRVRHLIDAVVAAVQIRVVKDARLHLDRCAAVLDGEADGDHAVLV